VPDQTEESIAKRKFWMSTLAKAKSASVGKLFPDLPMHEVIRAPETGTVMVRGRAGGTGAPFNLGEMTVTRCAVRLPDGTIGHGYVQGRDGEHATRAAIIDALMQGVDAERVAAEVINPLEAEFEASRQSRAEKAAATKVDFFTMVRGEDQ